MNLKHNYFIFFQATIFSLNLSILSPLINSISNEYNIDLQTGYFVVGGLNNVLLFGSMAISSLLFSFYNSNISIRLYNLFLFFANLLIFFNLNLVVFLVSNILIGLVIGIIIPTLIKIIKRNIHSNHAVQAIVLFNIMIGLGQILGQYLSATFLDYQLKWNFVFLFIALLFLMNLFLTFIIKNDNDFSNCDSILEFTTNVKIAKESKLYLSQYLPGSIPWGALTVFIFPFSAEIRNSSASLVATYMVILSIGMLVGSIMAGYMADKLHRAKKKIMLLSIIFFLILSFFYLHIFISFYSVFSNFMILILIFFMGCILSIPGTYIKGLLFIGSNPLEIQRIFAIENFLESFGKGFGPFVVSILIFYTNDILYSFKMIGIFWIFCVIPIVILFISELKNEKRY